MQIVIDMTLSQLLQVFITISLLMGRRRLKTNHLLLKKTTIFSLICRQSQEIGDTLSPFDVQKTYSLPH